MLPLMLLLLIMMMTGLRLSIIILAREEVLNAIVWLLIYRERAGCSTTTTTTSQDVFDFWLIRTGLPSQWIHTHLFLSFTQGCLPVRSHACSLRYADQTFDMLLFLNFFFFSGLPSPLKTLMKETAFLLFAFALTCRCQVKLGGQQHAEPVFGSWKGDRICLDSWPGPSGSIRFLSLWLLLLVVQILIVQVNWIE